MRIRGIKLHIPNNYLLVKILLYFSNMLYSFYLYSDFFKIKSIIFLEILKIKY